MIIINYVRSAVIFFIYTLVDALTTVVFAASFEAMFGTIDKIDILLIFLSAVTKKIAYKCLKLNLEVLIFLVKGVHNFLKE